MSLRSSWISLLDLYLAYRKAKAEAYYENTHFHALAFCEYEQNLDRNLRRLLRRLSSLDQARLQDPEWLGGHSYAPKAVQVESAAEDGSPVFFRSLDPAEEWRRRWPGRDRLRANAEFRLVITPSVEYQIFSALWILKAGHKFDAALNREVSFGNRLRRRNAVGTLALGQRNSGTLNLDCLGLFDPYFSAYRSWRARGLSAMRAELRRGGNVLALTMDLQRFYHQVSAQFLLRPKYLQRIGIELSDEERSLTQLLIRTIAAWYAETPDSRQRPQGALPVGLSASKVIANVLLTELDARILESLRPLYYGRYVDDIFLVLRNDGGVDSGSAAMQYLARALPGILRIQRGGGGLRLSLEYARDSKLVFAGTKQKVFSLAGAYGLDLVEQISEQIRRQSSEHRLLPELPDTTEGMATRTLLAQSDASLESDALRKADVISVRRLGLSFLLRDIESYARDLQPRAWVRLRRAFYGLVTRHVVTPVGFFDFAAYIHRVLGLMVACRDLGDAIDLVRRLRATMDLIRSTTTAGTTESAKFLQSKRFYAQALLQVTLQATTVLGFRWSPRFMQLLMLLKEIDQTLPVPASRAQARLLSTRLLYSDWGRRPYRDAWLHSSSRALPNPPVPGSLSVRRLLRLGAIRAFRQAADLRVPYWPGVAFPTRPIGLSELTLAAPGLLSQPGKLRAALFALRGAQAKNTSGVTVVSSSRLDGRQEIVIDGARKRRYEIAIPSFLTKESEWEAAVAGRSATTLDRYERIRHLINQILRLTPSVDYVVFPECSVPRAWANGIAYKLAQRGVSFIAGLEYAVTSQGVRNDAFLSLTTDWPWHASSVLVLQPKCAPAHEERKALWNRGRKRLFVPTGPASLPPVYVHGGVCLGVLICSDLTNISHRRRFQGFIDALVVLEWNRDIETFSSLVEATATDLHAYVVQANNRSYGDSRVRVPRTKNYERDVVRVRGGVHDYFVVIRMDIAELRAFQRRNNRGDEGAFKPLPIGYVMSGTRRS